MNREQIIKAFYDAIKDDKRVITIDDVPDEYKADVQAELDK